MFFLKIFKNIPFLFILTLFFSCKLEARQDNHYSLITIENWTPYRVSYTYQWGEGDVKRSRGVIEPNETYRHWWTFDHPNQDWAPWFWLHIDGDGDKEWYKLGSYFSPNTEAKNGKLYILLDEEKDGKTQIYLWDEEDLWW